MDWGTILTNIVNSCIGIASRLVLSLVVFVIGRVIIKFLVKKFPNNPKNSHIDPTARTFIASFMKIALNCVLIVTIVAIMGVPMASVLTVFATAGAAIALAVQGSFSNMMGGIMLLIFRPISKGDYVDIGGKAGTVNEIGIFYTQLKTPDNLTVSIPNGAMTSSTIINYSREKNRRVDVVVDVAYDTDIAKAREVLAGVIAGCEFALEDPKSVIMLTAMADSSIQFSVRVWVPASKYHATKEYLLEASLLAFDKAGIEIPYNKLDVNVINNK